MLSNSWFWASVQLWPYSILKQAQPPTATTLGSASAPENLRFQACRAPSAVPLWRVGRAWGPYDVSLDACLWLARYMQRITHPSVLSNLLAFFFFFHAHCQIFSGILALNCGPRLQMLYSKAGHAVAEYQGNVTSWGKTTSKCSAVFSPDLILISFEWFCA